MSIVTAFIERNGFRYAIAKSDRFYPAELVAQAVSQTGIECAYIGVSDRDIPCDAPRLDNDVEAILLNIAISLDCKSEQYEAIKRALHH